MNYEEIIRDLFNLGYINGFVECRSDYNDDKTVGVSCYYEYTLLAHKYDIELEQNIPDDKYSAKEIWDIVNDLSYKIEQNIYKKLNIK